MATRKVWSVTYEDNHVQIIESHIYIGATSPASAHKYHHACMHSIDTTTEKPHNSTEKNCEI